jgi:hypothetical protein
VLFSMARKRDTNFQGATRSHYSRALLMTVAVLAIAVAGLGASGGPARAHPTAHISKTGAAPCKGRARRIRFRHVSISFTCDNDVTGFEIRANRALRSFEEPNAAFGCDRATSRSFRCEDIHSGAAPEGNGVAIVSEPLCRRGAHLVLRISPAFDFERPTGVSFTLKGPC